MPQGLPTSDSLPMQPPQRGIHVIAGSAPVTTTDTASLVIKKETAVSLCETLISSAAVSSSMTHTHGEHSTPQTINLVVSSTSSQPISVAQISSDTTTAASSQFHLTEIVQQEKDFLFNPTVNPDVELEPPRPGVPFVRRRSIQYFTLLEEDNTDDESIIPNFGERKSDPLSQTQPVVNIGEGFKRFYIGQNRRKGNEKDREHHPSGEKTCGYESDPEGRYELSKLLPGIRRNQSHPELTKSEIHAPMQFSDDYQLNKAKSLPGTPKVSPTLKRRNSQKSDEHGKEVAKSGPGFSFLAHVAGELHRRKVKHDGKQEQGLMRVTESLDITTRTTQTVHTTVASAISQVSTTSALSGAPLTETGTVDPRSHHFTDFAHTEEVHSSTPQFLKKIIDWGTKKKVKVNKKETNMWSPSSF